MGIGTVTPGPGMRGIILPDRHRTWQKNNLLYCLRPWLSFVNRSVSRRKHRKVLLPGKQHPQRRRDDFGLENFDTQIAGLLHDTLFHGRVVCSNVGQPALTSHSRLTHFGDVVGMLRK